MWRMTPRLAIATLTATLAIALAPAPKADAASVQSYSYTTYGEISGTSGVQPIEFNGLDNNGTLTTPGAFTLGQFTTEPLPATATLTYNNTPFTIDLNVGAAGYQPYGYNPNTYQYVISGVLNGSISGDGTSNMVATVSSITGSGYGSAATPPFPIADLTLIAPQGIAAPDGDNEGVSTLTAQVVISGPGNPQPTPEPTSIAVFAAAIAGWAIRRRSRSKAVA